MGFCWCKVHRRFAADKPTLKNQEVGITASPTAAVPTAIPSRFVKAGHLHVLALSPLSKAVLQKVQVVTSRQCTRHTPGVASHCCIKPIRLEIKIIERNHLNGEAKTLCGGFDPLPEGRLPTSR